MLKELRSLAERARNDSGVVVGITVRDGRIYEHWPFVSAATPAAIVTIIDRCVTAECERDAVLAEVDRLRRLLAECYVLSGADPDGNTPETGADHLWPMAVTEVRCLRQEYDETCEEVRSLERERDALRAVAERDRQALLGFIDAVGARLDELPADPDAARATAAAMVLRANDEARAEAEHLRAELAEARATLDNERGEGEPPVPGWVYANGCWTFGAWTIWREADRIATCWVADFGGESMFDRPTARAAMRAASEGR